MSQAPVGRAREWERLDAQLTTGRSALVLISGPTGSGRTHLVRSFGQRAAEQGFTTVGVEADQPLVIEPTTKLNDVRRTLTALLDGQEALVEEPTATGASVVRWFKSAVADRVGDDSSVMSLITGHAPLVIAVDGYEPGPGLGMWVVTRLLAHIRTADHPVLLVITDRPERLEGLRGNADEVVELAELDVDEVEQHLREVTADATNPLEPAELAAYSSAVSQDPSLLKAFEAVLALLPRGRDGHVQA